VARLARRGTFLDRCLFHVDRGPVLLAGIVGAILSVLFAESYRAVVPSAESQQLAVARNATSDLKNALTSQGNALRLEVAGYQGQLEKERNESADRERSHLAQLLELNAKLDPFIKTAIARYPGLGVDEALERLRGQLEEVRAMASPPRLLYRSHAVERRGQHLVLSVRLAPSKNVPLGALVFVAALPPSSPAIITSFWPTLDGGAFLSGDNSKKIAEDGKKARLEYSLLGAGLATLELEVTAETEVRLEGNHDLQPLKFVIRAPP
jgi:hypothetical protein